MDKKLSISLFLAEQMNLRERRVLDAAEDNPRTKVRGRPVFTPQYDSSDARALIEWFTTENGGFVDIYPGAVSAGSLDVARVGTRWTVPWSSTTGIGKTGLLAALSEAIARALGWKEDAE